MRVEYLEYKVCSYWNNHKNKEVYAIRVLCLNTTQVAYFLFWWKEVEVERWYEITKRGKRVDSVGFDDCFDTAEEAITFAKKLETRQNSRDGTGVIWSSLTGYSDFYLSDRAHEESLAMSALQEGTAEGVDLVFEPEREFA